MLYDRLANHLFGDEEKPTPQHILDSLPKVKVTISQLGRFRTFHFLVALIMEF